MSQVTPVVQQPSIRELQQEWVVWMEISKGLSASTIRMYTKNVQWAARDLDLMTATTEDLQKWVQRMGGSASTVGNRVCALVSFYRFLVKTKKRPDNPAAEMDRPRRRKGVPKPVKDLEHALSLLDQQDVRANETGWPRRVGESRDIAVFLAETGLRISEACSIHLEGPAPRELTIIGKGNKEAIVLLTDKAREAIDRLGGALPLTSRGVQRRFRKVGFHPHMLRHWRATSLVQARVEIGTISKIMRHSSPAITMVYAEYATDIMRDALDLVP